MWLGMIGLARAAWRQWSADRRTALAGSGADRRLVKDAKDLSHGGARTGLNLRVRS
jgi:hypothetical protein